MVCRIQMNGNNETEHEVGEVGEVGEGWSVVVGVGVGEQTAQYLVEEVADVFGGEALRAEESVHVGLHQRLHHVDVAHVLDTARPVRLLRHPQQVADVDQLHFL